MSTYDFSVERLQGGIQSLADYRGQVLLIVNVASRCGLAPQYAGLEALYRRYRDQGFSVLGFPCNQFANQEPGSAEEIASFCSLTYDVSFPLFARIDVNGPQAAPLFVYLRNQAPGLLGSTAVKWNFTKFLVDREGNVVRRFAPTDTPEQIEQVIADLLAAPIAV
jgi:glutathione peroxidase